MQTSDWLSRKGEFLKTVQIIPWVLDVWISEMTLDDFYHSGFSDYHLYLYCYIHNILADVSPPFFRCFLSNSGAYTELRITVFI